MVLHIAGTLNRTGGHVFKLAKERGHVFSDNVHQGIEAAAVRHSNDHFRHPRGPGEIENGIENDHGALAAFQAKPLLPGVALMEELLERLSRIQPTKNLALGIYIEGRIDPLYMTLNPFLLNGIHDVHVLNADGAAVCIAKNSEQLPERVLVGPGNHAGKEFALKIPYRQFPGDRVELGGHGRGLGVERVEVGNQVAARPIRIDDFLNCRSLFRNVAARRHGIGITVPTSRFVGDAHRFEYFVVERFLTHKESLHGVQERSGLGTLNDPVVVRGSKRDYFPDSNLSELGRIGGHERRREINGAEPDDRRLSGHQPGNRVTGSNATGIRNRYRHASKIIDRQLVDPGLGDDGLVGGVELVERQCVRRFDARDNQAA